MTSPLIKLNLDSSANKEPTAPVEAKATVQVYMAAKQSFAIITPKGKPLQIINYRFATANKADIEFLDAEIANGFNILEKGERVAATDLDPVASLRARLLAEVRAEIAAEASGAI